MDDKRITEALKSFPAVWKRVQESKKQRRDLPAVKIMPRRKR